jgi:Fe-S-cluster containining protein
VWVNDEEVAALAEYRGEPVRQFEGLYVRRVDRRRSLREKANGDCVFYDRSAGCTVYPVRPRQCRTWPFWDVNVATPEAWRRTCEVCPGSGRGELVSADEIARRLRVITL